jgi:hypothetical protein
MATHWISGAFVVFLLILKFKWVAAYVPVSALLCRGICDGGSQAFAEGRPGATLPLPAARSGQAIEQAVDRDLFDAERIADSALSGPFLHIFVAAVRVVQAVRYPGMPM